MTLRIEHVTREELGEVLLAAAAHRLPGWLHLLEQGARIMREAGMTYTPQDARAEGESSSDEGGQPDRVVFERPGQENISIEYDKRHGWYYALRGKETFYDEDGYLITFTTLSEGLDWAFDKIEKEETDEG